MTSQKQSGPADEARAAYDLESAVKVGFLGQEVDGTDDHHYTVAGVTAAQTAEPAPSAKSARSKKEES